jgi:2-oxoglutarate ferredoxin oxidoreductase subunit alpha
LARKYEAMARTECRHETCGIDDQVDVLLVAYGTVARICKTAIETLRGSGIRAGLFRPISLFPYPGEALVRAASRAKHVLVSELSTGQMVEDVRYHLGPARPVAFYGRTGGMLVTPEELVDQARTLAAA